MELRADCFAGVWTNSTAERGILETGDVEEGLKAAAAIGDDRLQKMSGREVQPESFAHGTSEQRMRWRHFHDGSVLARTHLEFPFGFLTCKYGRRRQVSRCRLENM